MHASVVNVISAQLPQTTVVEGSPNSFEDHTKMIIESSRPISNSMGDSDCSNMLLLKAGSNLNILHGLLTHAPPEDLEAIVKHTEKLLDIPKNKVPKIVMEKVI